MKGALHPHTPHSRHPHFLRLILLCLLAVLAYLAWTETASAQECTVVVLSSEVGPKHYTPDFEPTATLCWKELRHSPESTASWPKGLHK